MLGYHINAMKTLPLSLICLSFLTASLSYGGTFSVTDVTTNDSVVAYTGDSSSHSEGVEILGSNWVRWHAQGDLYRATYGGAFGGIVTASPRIKWKVEFAPAYLGELPPSQAHCKIRMMGHSQSHALLSGYPAWGLGAGVSTMVAAWSGNSPASSVTAPTGSLTASDTDGTGAPYAQLTDAVVYTGAFVWNGTSGRWEAYAEQTFIGSVHLSVHLGAASGTVKTGRSAGHFDQKAAIYEIDGQSIPI